MKRIEELGKLISEDDPSQLKKIEKLILVDRDIRGFIGQGTALIGENSKAAREWAASLMKAVKDRGIFGDCDVFEAGRKNPEAALGRSAAGSLWARTTGNNTANKFETFCLTAIQELSKYSLVDRLLSFLLSIGT